MAPTLLRFFCTVRVTNERILELGTFRCENEYLSHHDKTIVMYVHWQPFTVASVWSATYRSRAYDTRFDSAQHSVLDPIHKLGLRCRSAPDDLDISYGEEYE
ncbi:hypothetical protein TNCV_825121 [Trichonephila clavipes]|nr:hypothetical protein TNCV_825121 [Trichonephila clavipes]